MKHALSVLQTSHKSTPRGPHRRVDHSMTLESLSFSATEPTSGSIVASPKQRTRADRTCRSRDTISVQLGAYGDAHGGWRHVGWDSLGRATSRRFRPHSHTCGTSPWWLASIEARVPEANIDLCHLDEDMRSGDRQAATYTCAVVTVEARPVGVPSGGGQWACQVAGHADDLQPSGGGGRVRHRPTSAKAVETVREKVNGEEELLLARSDHGQIAS